ncbi:leucine-rich repeat-containing protein 74A isoform X2 [Hydra vulgaris]|uniref:leucine-rich repeat-containing protein 74A isoform X2 n=1 Tax=Hydra vulgaris TaxID=6087 RepID=UPI0032E9EF3A
MAENLDKRNEEYETDIDTKDHLDLYDATGRSAYFEACKRYSVIPITHFLNKMTEEEMNLQYYGAGAKGAKAISAALLNLSANFMGPEGCRYVSEMLHQNISLKRLNISKNNFGDSVGQYLCDAFKNNFKLTWLDLSSNGLSDKVAAAISPGIDGNDALEYLNLSWNQFRGKAMQNIAMGLRANCALKVLDISWNGFSNEGAIGLAEALKVNNTLIELDISNNRISMNGCIAIAKSLDLNNTLEVLKMNFNPITPNGANTLLNSISNKSDSAIKELHLKGVLVQHEFIEKYEVLKKTKNITVQANFHVLPQIEIIRNYTDKNKELWIRSFSEFDPTFSNTVTIAQFDQVLQKIGFNFSVEERMPLLAKLKKNSQGKINYMKPKLGFSKAYSNSVEK